MMDKSFIGPAGRRDYVCSSRALRFPLKKFRRFSAATFWPFVSFAFFSFFSLNLSFLWSKELRMEYV